MLATWVKTLYTPHISLCYFWRYIDTSTLIKIICKLSPKLWVIHSVLLNMFLLLRFFSGFDLICLNLYSLIYATSSLISELLISDLFLLFHALLVLNYTTTFNPLCYRKIFLMHFRLEQGSNVVFNHLNEKKSSTGGMFALKCYYDENFCFCFGVFLT